MDDDDVEARLLEELGALAAGEFSSLMQAIDGLSPEVARGLLLIAVLKVASLEHLEQALHASAPRERDGDEERPDPDPPQSGVRRRRIVLRGRCR